MRQLAIGNRSLMDGFGLLGMEIYPDPTPDEVMNILTELSRSKEKALVFLQQGTIGEEVPIVQQLRNEGGNILISEIPGPTSVNSYQAPVDQLIHRVLGANFDLEVDNG